MSAPLHQVVREKCKGDGICAEICPKGVLEIADGVARTAQARSGFCIDCGQCVAVCPNDALELIDAKGAEFPAARKWSFSLADLMACWETRRSVRNFSDKPVSRDLVDQVIDAASLAPPGFPPSPVEIVVLDRKDDIEYLATSLRAGYAKLLKMWGNPIGRTIIGLRRGKEMTRALGSHVIPIVREDNAWFDRNGQDRYLYGAPVVLLLHVSRWVAGYEETTMVVATYAMIAAHVAGLGATMLSIVPPIFNNLGDELRPRFGIPDDNKVIVALVMGHPKYRYHRGVRRPLKKVSWHA